MPSTNVCMFSHDTPGVIELDWPRNRPLRGPFSTSHASSRFTSSGVPIGNVRVMNLYEDVKLNGFRQDQLCRINVVPAPGAVLLAGLGTTLIGYLRRLRYV